MKFGKWLAMAGVAAAFAGIGMAGRLWTVSASGQATSQLARTDPNAACAPCHRAIYDKYRNTPMARASGPASEGFLPGDFTHPASGISYRMANREGRVYLEFSRNAAAKLPAGAEDRSLKGERELRYFLGSGTRGRTYLFEQEGYWFEIPINWYGKKHTWDMAPNYLDANEMPLTLAVDPSCLRCHASAAQPSLPVARNKYAGAPFLESGITCTACHGDAKAHLASEGQTAMPKIDALPAARRDSICLSCHLEGQQVVVHQGKRLVDFQPGESIFEYASFFVRQTATGPTAAPDARATSQWEALLQSGCKRAAGEKLTCTSCHDPHGTTSAMDSTERIIYYRTKCLACHDGGNSAGQASAAVSHSSFGAIHHPENPDCASCHMPRARAGDIAHEQVTDHRIPRFANFAKAAVSSRSSETGAPLVAVGEAAGVPGPSTDRDLGLAYAFAASRGDRQAGERAIPLLNRAETLPQSASDAPLHEQLGFLHQLANENDAAAREYKLALQADPYDAVAAGDLALIEAASHRYAEAVELWERAFTEDPAQLKAGMNLAIVACGLGRREAALGALDRILAFSPDNGQARQLALAIRSGAHSCPASPTPAQGSRIRGNSGATR